MFSEPNAQRKFLKMIDLINESYYSTSKIEDILNVVQSDITISYDFIKYGRGLKIPKLWFTDPSYYPNMVFEQLGSDASLAEIIYVSQKIPEMTKIQSEILEFTPELLIKKILELTTYPDINRITIFIPINYYVKFHTEWANTTEITLDYRTGEFFIGNKKLKIIWSNKYNDFKDVILMNRDIGLWICKNKVDERLDIIYYSDEDEENINLIIENVFYFKLLVPEKIIIISPTNIP